MADRIVERETVVDDAVERQDTVVSTGAHRHDEATGGAIAGAVGGAVVGSVVPVVGTAVGAVVGAAVGRSLARPTRSARTPWSWSARLAPQVEPECSRGLLPERGSPLVRLMTLLGNSF
ncbi:MAG TPA: hypothetical protein VNF73_13000, partial [Candidatus Saccharimonadales bacterium]|nr:hypothetical protein [Candidatus Saccharimonadales bacterium]